MLNLKRRIKSKKKVLIGAMLVGLLLPSAIYANQEKQYNYEKFDLTTYWQRSSSLEKRHNGSSTSSTNAGAFAINTSDYKSVRGVIRLQDPGGSTNYSDGYTHPAKARKTYANKATAGNSYRFIVRSYTGDPTGNFEGFWSPDNY